MREAIRNSIIYTNPVGVVAFLLICIVLPLWLVSGGPSKPSAQIDASTASSTPTEQFDRRTAVQDMTTRLSTLLFTTKGGETPEAYRARLAQQLDRDEMSIVDTVQHVFCYEVVSDGESASKGFTQPDQRVGDGVEFTSVRLPDDLSPVAYVTARVKIVQEGGSAVDSSSRSCPATAHVQLQVGWQQVANGYWKLKTLTVRQEE